MTWTQSVSCDACGRRNWDVVGGVWTCQHCDKQMTPHEIAKARVAELEAEFQHACAIAACSVGQPDRTENVNYREKVRENLLAAQRDLAMLVSG